MLLRGGFYVLLEVTSFSFGIMEKLKGNSYKVRCEKINAIYDKWVKKGLTNREIWRRFIYPEYGISERTFYKALKYNAIC